MHPVSLLVKPASGLCNMRCDYCFYCDVMHSRQQQDFGIMSDATLQAMIQKTLAFAQGSCTIAYQGGEPTLAGLDFFKRSVALQKQYNIHNLPLHNALQTNGFGITEEWAEFFAQNNFLIGLSLDGTKKSHDAYRHSAAGEGTFHRVMQTAELLKKHKVEFNILTVVNRRTVQSLAQMYAFYKKCGFGYWQFIPCLDPLGTPPGGQEYSLTPALYGNFLCQLFDLWFTDLQTGTQPYIRMFENYVGIACGIAPESCDMRGVCGMQYVVEADGSVYPCDFYVLDEYRLGDFTHNDYPDFDAMRTQTGFVEASIPLPEECKTCPHYALCRGGCRRNRTGLGTGDIHNYFCESYRAFFAHASQRIAHIAAVVQRSSTQ